MVVIWLKWAPCVRVRAWWMFGMKQGGCVFAWSLTGWLFEDHAAWGCSSAQALGGWFGMDVCTQECRPWYSFEAKMYQDVLKIMVVFGNGLLDVEYHLNMLNSFRVCCRKRVTTFELQETCQNLLALLYFNMLTYPKTNISIFTIFTICF